MTRKRSWVVTSDVQVKHKLEPLYSTLLSPQLQPPPMFEDTALYANYAPASLYSNYSNYR